MKQRALLVATFNINGVVRRLPALLAWLERAQPDVVCLQEIKIEDAAFPAAALARAGYGAVWRGQRSWHGVAILARGADPVLTRRDLPGDAGDTEPRYIEAAVQGVLVGCLYLPNGNPRPGPKFDYKMAWFGRLLIHAESLLAAGVPVVLAGDYNVVPTDADIYATRSYRENALLQPEPRAAYRALLDGGWVDAVAAYRGDAPGYTFWSYERDRWGRDAGLRLDHLLVSPVLAPRLRAAGVDRWVRGLAETSDHAPAWARFGRGSTYREGGHRALGRETRVSHPERESAIQTSGEGAFGHRAHRALGLSPCIGLRRPYLQRYGAARCTAMVFRSCHLGQRKAWPARPVELPSVDTAL